jgi:ribosomal-protein-serine acetyltransferase
VKRLKLKGGAELRPLTEADVHELWALIEANREHLRPWMPWAADQTPERTLAFVRQAVRQEIANDGFQAALRVDGRIAGVAGYHGVDRQNATTTLGYWLAAPYEGRGLMTAAVDRLVSHAFGEWRLHRVELRAAPANTRSRAIAERLGFREEGLLREAERFGEEFRDLVLYSVLEHEWPAR